MASTNAIILFGHGSRDPLWRLPIESVAARVAVLAPHLAVRCAYLELTAPDLPAAVEELVGLGVNMVTIAPMFLGVGRHVRDDLPLLVEGLRARFPAITFDLRPPVGEDARVLDLLADVVLGD